SASAYQKPLSNYLVTESTPLANPYWQYSRNKIACEETLMGYYRQSAFPVTIVRPSHTYGPGGVPVGLHGQGGSWQVLQRMRQGRPILIHGDGSSLWTFTHSTDFAPAFAGLVGNPHAIGEAVHITADESLTWNQAYAIIAAALGVPLKATYAPSHFLAASGKPFGYDFEGSLLGDKATSVVFDNTKIKRLVPGWAAVKRFDEGVRESVANLLATPALQTPDPAFDLYCEKVEAALQNALAAVLP
ncbi:MAG: NAD-dependent epimerase/dehydratase family protein, partial [Oscillospiraceae bacterium]